MVVRAARCETSGEHSLASGADALETGLEADDEAAEFMNGVEKSSAQLAQSGCIEVSPQGLK